MQFSHLHLQEFIKQQQLNAWEVLQESHVPLPVCTDEELYQFQLSKG